MILHPIEDVFRGNKKFYQHIDAKVGKLGVKYHHNMVLGELYPEIGYITQTALSNGGVEIENTGSDPLVLTFDFPQNAHSQIPGVS